MTSLTPRAKRGPATPRAKPGTAQAATAAADALQAWLEADRAQHGAGRAVALRAPEPDLPKGASSSPDSSVGPGVPVAPPLDEMPEPAGLSILQPTALRLPHPDWLFHQLFVTGPSEVVTGFERAAAGAGIIPWQLDFDQLEEDTFHLLMTGSAGPNDRLSAAGAWLFAGEVRHAVAHRHARTLASVGQSQTCPFDLQALLPVPAHVLALGPDDPLSLAWLWTYWGTTEPLRYVAADPSGASRTGLGAAGEDGRFWTFWSADWTPWAALRSLQEVWPFLIFACRPV